MKYVITGSLGNISKPLSQKLLAAGHDVTVITSSSEKVEAIEALGAKAAAGSVEDVPFLTQTFQGADAVYTMVPPNWGAANWKAWIGSIGSNYAAALQAARVPFAVNLSSIGAHMPYGCGPVSGLYLAEQALNKLEHVNIKHLRPAYFFQNLFAQVALIQQAGIMGANFGSTPFPVVHTNDIAEVAAAELLSLSFTGHSVQYIAGDEVTGSAIAAELGKAIGKPGLQWVEFSDADNLQGLLQAGLPEEVANNYTELGSAMRSGAMAEDYNMHRPALSNTKLEQFAREFAAAFKA